MRQFAIVFLTVLGAAACGYGMTAEKLRHTSSPYGVAAHLVTSRTEYRGELLQVQDTGVLVLTSSNGTAAAPTAERRLRLLPYSAIRNATFDQVGKGYTLSNGRPPEQNRRKRLQLVSRFPHGLPPEQLQQLLASCGQTQVAGEQP